MAVNIKGLKDNARKTSIATLNGCVADAIDLGLAIKQAHWNVKGKNFIAVHELFDMVHANVVAQVDTMAEQVQVLDGVALGTAKVVAKTARLEAYPTDLTKAEDHIRALCERLRAYGGALREGIAVASEAGDADTADILTAASRQADKDLWFLSSHLD